MIIQNFPSGYFATNAYIAACPKTKKAAIIDPAPDSSKKILRSLEAKGLIPEAILITHSHWDHIADVAVLKETLLCPVFIHPLDVGNLKEPGSDGLPLWLDIKGVLPDRLLSEGEEISIGELTFTVIHTPGHTPGGVCFYEKKQHVLFSGDTLFQGTIGNLSFPTAIPKAMWQSLKKLALLPSQTVVYPGHGPSTTIGAENWLEQAEQLFGENL